MGAGIPAVRQRKQSLFTVTSPKNETTGNSEHYFEKSEQNFMTKLGQTKQRFSGRVKPRSNPRTFPTTEQVLPRVRVASAWKPRAKDFSCGLMHLHK